MVMVNLSGENQNSLWIAAGREYLRYLRSKNRSPDTLESYAGAIKRASHLHLTRDAIEGYFDSLWQTSKPATVLHHHKNLRAFLNWCVRAGYLAANPMNGIPEPRVRPNIVEPYTPEQARALYAAAASLRDRVLVAVLLNTGIRIGEMRSLKPADVHSGRLLIHGKGSRQRWVGIEPRTETLLKSHISMSPAETVFGVERRTLYWAIRRMGDRAGVPKAHPHRFRDTFAVRFLENGGNIDDLQVILGHSNISMTLRYIQWGRAERAIQGQMQYAPSVYNRAQ
jgi:integrase